MRTANILISLSILFSAVYLEARTFSEIKKSKILRIATRNRSTIAHKTPGGLVEGFHYCMVSGFARAHKLNVAIEWRPFRFSEYFVKKGIPLEKAIKDPSISYTPDVLSRNDVLVDGFSVRPWRKKLARFVHLNYGRQIVIYNTTKMSEPKSIKDLKGKTVYVKAGTIGQELAEGINKKVPINIHVIKEGIKKKKGNDLAPLLAGKSDFMIYSSTYSLADIKKNPKKLGFGFPVGKLDGGSWIVEKDNNSLAQALSVYIETSKQNGAFDRCFKAEYGLAYDDYLRSLSVIGSE